MSDLALAAAALGAAPSVAVVSHVNPEGDAIGSVLAAALALRGVGKQTGAFNADPLPPGLQHLPGVAEFRREMPRDRSMRATWSWTAPICPGREASSTGDRRTRWS